MTHFKEDSPDFRKTLEEHEESLLKITSIFKVWTEKAHESFLRGKEYCESLNSLFTIIDESGQQDVLLSYRPFFSAIAEVLLTVEACNEGIIHSLSQVFPSKLEDFSSEVLSTLQSLKKSYEKSQKDLEALRYSTLTYKKSYVSSIQVKKNPAGSEEHFLRVHNAEKSYETSRFEYYSFMSHALVQGQLLGVEQCLSLLYSIYSFTNTALDKYKVSEKEINKISERLSLSKKGLLTLQESLKKEKEAQELRLNMFVKIPQFREDKAGFLWKKGNLITEWKRRFFFMKDSQLLYFRDNQYVPYVQLHMIKAYELKDSDFLFAFEVLSSSPYAKFVFLADSEADMKEWLYVLNKSSEQGLLGFSDTDYSCADCLVIGPEWCSINLGVLLCSNCSGIHRSLGSHISKVRSLSLDTIDPVLKEIVYELHKDHLNIWGEGFRPPRFCAAEEREEYIRSKYYLKTWVKKIDNPNNLLTQAVSSNSVLKAAQAVIAGAKETSSGLLHQASKLGYLKIVAFLVNAGWQIEGKNSEAFTPLEVALLAGQTEVVEYIMKCLG